MIAAAAVMIRAVPTCPDGAVAVPAARPFLAHPANQEHLIVGGQAEQDRQDEHRQERLDRAGRA